MNKKNAFLAKIAFYALFLGLLFYAASRTLHFVQNTMPADQQFWGYLFLLATGIGSLIWLYVFLTFAEGAKQRAIAFSMGIIDLIGEAILVYADTVRVAGQNGLMTFNDQETRTFVIASVGIIILNIFAAFMFKLWDPEAERKGHSRDLVDDITAATFKELQTPESRSQMIGAMKPHMMNAILNQVEADVWDIIGKMGKQPGGLLNAPQILSVPPSGSTPARYEQTVAQQTTLKQNPLPGRADQELANSILPGIAPYRACPKCGDTVPLTQKQCAVCGTAMPPLHLPKKEAELVPNPDFTAYQHRPGEVRGLYVEPSYHPISMDPKPKEEPKGDAPFPIE